MINENFSSKGYCVVSSELSKDTVDLVTQYALFDEIQRFTPEYSTLKNNAQVPSAHSRYADAMMESLLLHLQPVVEKHTGLTLYPTYSYYRVYRPGDELHKHTDRPACEISITVSFEFEYLGSRDPWSIFIDGFEAKLQPGDMAIYKGIELEHWREKFDAPEGAWHVQAFLHYVDANGPYAEHKHDQIVVKRSSIGELPESEKPKINTVNKSYITYTK